jgi:RimJ/RimL family protein N-acetyltransferase
MSRIYMNKRRIGKMLDYAKKYESELVKLYQDIAFDPFYNFHQFSTYRETFKVPDDTMSGHQFVSLFNKEVLGYISYGIQRIENSVTSLGIIHFGGKDAEGGAVFGRDVMTALKDIFEKFGFNKITFCVAVGNPIEKTYDKLIKRYGGRIVGTFKKDIKLIDGKLYDVKHYEILAEEYFNSKKL